jgi:hypothetical protein
MCLKLEKSDFDWSFGMFCLKRDGRKREKGGRSDEELLRRDQADSGTSPPWLTPYYQLANYTGLRADSRRSFSDSS